MASADPIQNASRGGKLTWRSPSVAAKPADTASETPKLDTPKLDAPAPATPDKSPEVKAPDVKKPQVTETELKAPQINEPEVAETTEVVDAPAEKPKPVAKKAPVKAVAKQQAPEVANRPAPKFKTPALAAKQSPTRSPKTSSKSGSTLKVRDDESSTSTHVEVVESKSDDSEHSDLAQSSASESSTEQASADQHNLKPSRLDRAARPYSRSLARRSTVQRLGDADASSFSGGTIDSDTLINPIRQVAAVKEIGPNLVPEAKPEPATARERELIEQAGLQEGAAEQPSPFDREPATKEPANEGPDANQPNDQLAQGGLLPNRCPTPRDLKPLDQISINIAAEPGPFPAECGLGDETFVPRNFACTTYAWKASALCHKPLYFEDYDLERYGHTASPLLQPFISAAQFYLVLPILPYRMGLEPPGECIYALGYYRPGSCAPRIIPNVPISLRGALLEAGVWVAGVALIP